MQRMLGLAAQKGGMQALKDATDPDQVKAINDALPETMAPLRATVRDPKTFTVWNERSATSRPITPFAARTAPQPCKMPIRA